MELIEQPEIKKPVSPKAYSRGNYLVAITIDIFILYVVNNLISNIPHPLDQYASKDYPGIIENIVNWAANFQVSFLTHDFVSCLWAINLALGFGIMGNFVLLLYRPNWFHHLVQAVLCATGFLAAYLVFKTFPLDINSSSLITVVRVLLILIMAGLSIGLIVELIKFIKNPISTDKNNPRESDGSGQI